MVDSQAEQISRHAPQMYRVAYRMLADEDRARDAVQEACVKALTGVERFKGQGAISTWLHRITVNCVKDAMRSNGRKENAHNEFRLQPEVRGTAHSASEAAEIKELSGLAWRLWEQLPEDCRSAFALTQLDGYSYDEAAEIEGEPRGTIASRVFRAKKILLEQMNMHLGAEAKS